MAVVDVTTYSDIQDLVSQLLNDTSVTFYPLNDRKRAINSSYKKLMAEAMDYGDGESPSFKKALITITTDVDYIQLPSDHYKTIKIYYKESENNIKDWINTNPSQRSFYNQKFGRSSKRMAYFHSVETDGTKRINLIPTPDYTDSTKLNIEYIPNFDGLDEDTDEPLLPKTHRELIAWEAYRRLIGKERIELTSTEMSVYQDLRAAFTRDMESQSIGESRTINGDDEYDIYGAQ